jgi:glycine oxidase
MSDVLVVGGGIVGLLSALELTQRGRRVTLLDASNAVPAASWAGGGILSPLYAWRYSDAMNALCVDAVGRYAQLLGILEKHSALKSHEVLHQGGMWVEVARDERRRVIDWTGRWSHEAYEVSASNVMPGCAAGDGVLFPQLGNIRNPRLLKALRDCLRDLGVKQIGARIRELVPGRQGAKLVSENGQIWEAGNVLLCTGHQIGNLLCQLGVDLPLFPAKGEMLFYRASAVKVPAVMLTEEGYLIPRAGDAGDILVGSTLRIGDATPWPTVAGRYQLEALAARLCPALGEMRPLHHWAGVRPGLGRDYPYLGEVPGTRGVFAAAGHYRNGLVAAPASAEMLAQLICGESPTINPAPYSLSSRSSSSFFKR